MRATPFRSGLPLPAFVLRPMTALILAAVHMYLATAHLTSWWLGGLPTAARR
jgi:hypothetical protein